MTNRRVFVVVIVIVRVFVSASIQSRGNKSVISSRSESPRDSVSNLDCAHDGAQQWRADGNTALREGDKTPSAIPNVKCKIIDNGKKKKERKIGDKMGRTGFASQASFRDSSRFYDPAKDLT